MFLVLAALLPAVFLMIYVYRHDKVEREPGRLIVKTLILGALSIIPAVILENIFESVGSLFLQQGSVMAIIVENMIGVALIEEFCKYLAVKIAVWKRPEFNYKFDAIVYCVAAAIGFAALENVFYVLDGGLGVALLRAVLSVPSHAIDGLIMGYYFGVAKEAQLWGDHRRCRRNLRLAVFMPMIEHGIFDAAVSFENDAILILFFVFVVAVDIWAVLFIRKQSKNDRAL